MSTFTTVVTILQQTLFCSKHYFVTLFWKQNVEACSGFRSLRCRGVKKLRLDCLASLSNAAKKLRLSQAQAKKLDLCTKE